MNDYFDDKICELEKIYYYKYIFYVVCRTKMNTTPHFMVNLNRLTSCIDEYFALNGIRNTFYVKTEYLKAKIAMYILINNIEDY